MTKEFEDRGNTYTIHESKDIGEGTRSACRTALIIIVIITAMILVIILI